MHSIFCSMRMVTPLVLLFGFVPTGCGVDGQERICDPGATQSCICPDGGSGAQICSADGALWEECVCTDVCEGVTCSGHGDCAVKNGIPICVCEEGYHPEGLYCVEDIPCQKDCSGLECGPDPVCGESCGTCPEGQTCSLGTCVSDCTDTCASLGCDCGVVCGVSCGDCPPGWICTDCHCTCQPNCTGKQCGDNGCGGSCGQCGEGEECRNGECHAAVGEFTWNGCKLLYAGEIDVDEVLAAGFNTVICYINQARLDEALAKGLWVLPYLGDYFRPSENLDIAGAVAFVNQWKEHPAIGAWYFLDEPGLKSYTGAQQQEWYDAIKAADPDHDLLTVFASDPNRYVDSFNPNAFDHVGVDVYPFNQEVFDSNCDPLPDGWAGNWQGYLDYCLDRWNTVTGSYPSMAVWQAYHDIPRGMCSPAGNMAEYVQVFQNHEIGGQANGYAAYCWTNGLSSSSRGISEDPDLLSEATEVNAIYDWPHPNPSP